MDLKNLMVNNENKPPSSRRFLGISGRAEAIGPRIDPSKLGFSSGDLPRTNPANLPGVDKNPRQNRIPDIYTTCPELFQLKVKDPPIIEEPRYREPPIRILMSQQLNLHPYFYSDLDSKKISPYELDFEPKGHWSHNYLRIMDLREAYFSRRNGIGRRFDVKLRNALRITSKFPELYPLVGVMKLSDSIFKVDGRVFGRLLGINAINGGLFHRQGNFTRHGYARIFLNDYPELKASPITGDVDDIDVLLYKNSDTIISVDSDNASGIMD